MAKANLSDFPKVSDLGNGVPKGFSYSMHSLFTSAITNYY